MSRWNQRAAWAVSFVALLALSGCFSSRRDNAAVPADVAPLTEAEFIAFADRTAPKIIDAMETNGIAGPALAALPIVDDAGIEPRAVAQSFARRLASALSDRLRGVVGFAASAPTRDPALASNVEFAADRLDLKNRRITFVLREYGTRRELMRESVMYQARATPQPASPPEKPGRSRPARADAGESTNPADTSAERAADETEFGPAARGGPPGTGGSRDESLRDDRTRAERPREEQERGGRTIVRRNEPTDNREIVESQNVRRGEPTPLDDRPPDASRTSERAQSDRLFPSDVSRSDTPGGTAPPAVKSRGIDLDDDPDELLAWVREQAPNYRNRAGQGDDGTVILVDEKTAQRFTLQRHDATRLADRRLRVVVELRAAGKKRDAQLRVIFLDEQGRPLETSSLLRFRFSPDTTQSAAITSTSRRAVRYVCLVEQD
ncbi:MAG: hypothetical protein U1D55_01895 [Phycisphaerae bacterium]